MDLDRALSKLKFDETVQGYTLMTNDGQPFLSFALPEELLPQIQKTLKIHSSTLKLMNIMTAEGVVILARVDPNWILAVNFVDTQLGIALAKTQDVLRLLEQVELPPPPTAHKPPVTGPIPEQPLSEPPVSVEQKGETIEEIPLEKISVSHGCVVHRGPRFLEAMQIDSGLNAELRRIEKLGMDVLLLVDDTRTVFKISESLAKPVDTIIRFVRWCVSKRILDVECPRDQESGEREIVEIPVFEGDINNVKKEHRAVIELCNGTLTLNEIAQQLGITFFQALQCILPYRGKTLRIVKTDKVGK